MEYTCHYCEKDAPVPHSITIYDKTGVEDRYEILCDSCYEEWLHSLKG